MLTTDHHIDCPVCGSPNISLTLKAKDYTVTGEIFEIWHCFNCTHRFTQDAPAQEVIGRYYQSADYISHSETKKGLINALYHLVRNITLKGKLKLIKNVTAKTKGDILDIGCGTGSFLSVMQQAGWSVKGLEPDEVARKKGAGLYGLILDPIDQFTELPPQSFDVITMWHVLEHVHELHYYMQHLKSLLKPGGKLLIAVPNYTSKDAAHYKELWAAYDVPRHLYHFSPQSMRYLIEFHGMKIESIKPMWFDGFYVAMLSEKYKTGKTNLFSAFLNGLLSNLTAMTDRGKCSSVIYIIRS
ncbi:MAG: methyltransferase domain-containing protein [Sphingobacteriales bacterium]|nr:methyltransferase domain-containing protein [Sphingobacteriales bacterium]